jgi:hypothetical protein
MAITRMTTNTAALVLTFIARSSVQRAGVDDRLRRALAAQHDQ